MGFHRRHISNDQVIEIYKKDGMQVLKDWYSEGVDALVLESGLASEIDDILSLAFGLTDMDKWNTISEMITDEIKKGADETI